MRISALRKTVQFEPAAAAGGAMEGDAVDRFRGEIDAIAEEHRPSRMPFFARLANASPRVARSPALLGRVHLIYQAAMHATRAAVYHLPHLDNPAMRKRKLQIFIDDDGLPGGDTHHYQLTRAFRRMGARILLEDEEFGNAAELAHRLDGDAANFVRLVPELYARSLGPWCIVEVLSDNWMRALADSLAVHFPWVVDEPYFAECFAQGVEERHAEESLEVTEMVLRTHPQLMKQTLADAAMMAQALDGVWHHLDKVVQRFQ
jgi:pyrroloquinoline quinone (PQQ) biosynthesis protein C